MHMVLLKVNVGECFYGNISFSVRISRLFLKNLHFLWFFFRSKLRIHEKGATQESVLARPRHDASFFHYDQCFY